MPKQINPFRFKQFIIHHDRCAMKVGTDAVLLGAWANVEGAQSILDIGSGSGVIAIMLAQRTFPGTHIDAVEVDQSSFEQSGENILRTPWSQIIKVHHRSIQDFHADRKYDLIVSNPPYFIKSLLPATARRRDARHTSILTHGDILDAVGKHLNPKGRFAVILPATEGDLFQIEAHQAGIHCHRRTAFYSRRNKPQVRWLLEFTLTTSAVVSDVLVLYGYGGNWTPGYRRLIKDFYLDTEPE